jgi:hypothetical protein
MDAVRDLSWDSGSMTAKTSFLRLARGRGDSVDGCDVCPNELSGLLMDGAIAAISMAFLEVRKGSR